MSTPAAVPGTPTEIGQFLAASLPFMVNLQAITVTLDSQILVRLTRSMGCVSGISLLQHLNNTTHEGLMTVSHVQKTEVRVDADWRVYESDGSNTLRSAGKSMLVWSAGIKVTLNESSPLGSGLNKATKKAVPDTCSLQLLYVNLL